MLSTPGAYHLELDDEVMGPVMKVAGYSTNLVSWCDERASPSIIRRVEDKLPRHIFATRYEISLQARSTRCTVSGPQVHLSNTFHNNICHLTAPNSFQSPCSIPTALNTWSEPLLQLCSWSSPVSTPDAAWQAQRCKLTVSVLGKMWGTYLWQSTLDDTDGIPGNPANPELIQIPAGQLYLVRPNSIKGSRECIFKDAVATIRRTGVDFQYQLVVTRAYEEGEEQLLDEDAESESPIASRGGADFGSG